jgi:hypothetical protein
LGRFYLLTAQHRCKLIIIVMPRAITSNVQLLCQCCCMCRCLIISSRLTLLLQAQRSKLARLCLHAWQDGAVLLPRWAWQVRPLLSLPERGSLGHELLLLLVLELLLVLLLLLLHTAISQASKLLLVMHSRSLPRQER